jgi:AcrR family transcriptional regulator
MRKAGRPSAEEATVDRSEMLKKSALDLLSSRSFGAVTIKDIGREAGVTTAMIYYYFEDKDDLLRAAIEYAIDTAFERFASLSENIEHPAALIREWLRTHVDMVDSFSKMMKINLDYNAEGKRSQRIDEAIRRFYDTEAQVLTNCVKRGVDLGIFNPVDPEQIRVVVSTFLDGAMVRSRILSDYDLEGSVRIFETLLWEKLGYDGSAERQADTEKSSQG